MARFCVRICEPPPNEEQIVEAESLEDALSQRWLDLMEWADTVKVQAWPEKEGEKTECTP